MAKQLKKYHGTVATLMLKIWSLPKQRIKFNCALKFWLIRFTLSNQYQNSSQGNCVRELKSSEIYKSSKQAAKCV